jgi:hypothetical protein
MKKYKVTEKHPVFKYGTIINKHDDNFETVDSNGEIWSSCEVFSINYHLAEGWIEEIKEPLFITEDGVEIFYEKDVVYGVLPTAIWEKRVFNITTCLSESNKEWKYFSTKEAAEYWIDQNKPKYSIKQIRDAIDSTPLSTPLWDNVLIEKLGLLKKI